MIAVQQVLHFDGGIVRQAELPKRYLEIDFLRIVRIKQDMEEHEAAGCLILLGVVENSIVPGVVESQRREILERRMLAPQAVDETNIILNVAGLVHVPNAKLVLLGIQIFFLARHSGSFADLEAVIAAVVTAQGGSENEARAEARPAA